MSIFRSSSKPRSTSPPSRSSTSSRSPSHSQPRSSEDHDQESEQKERRLSVYLQERAHEKWVSEGVKERDFVPTDFPERTRAERVDALKQARKERAKENSKWLGGVGHLIAG